MLWDLIRPSDTSEPPTISSDGWLNLHSARSQWVGVGPLDAEGWDPTGFDAASFGPARPCWASAEFDVRHDQLDTDLTRWGGLVWAVADGRSFHDGTQNSPGGNLSLSLRHTGVMDLYSRSTATVTAKVATNVAGGVGTRSGAVLSPIRSGQVVRLRVENLRDAAGAWAHQAQVTRLDTGQWIRTAVGAAPVRGPFSHVGKVGVNGQRVSFGNLKVVF